MTFQTFWDHSESSVTKLSFLYIVPPWPSGVKLNAGRGGDQTFTDFAEIWYS